MTATNKLLASLPYHLQVSRILRQEIKTGQYAMDTPFPGELLLAARFGVSKDVIRVSLRNLAQDGLLTRVRGRGTFVQEAALQTRTDFVHLHMFQASYAALQIIGSVQGVLQARSLHLATRTVGCTDLKSEAEMLKGAAHAHCRAIIASPTIDERDQDNRKLYARIMRKGAALIIIDRQVPGLAADQVYFDYRSSMCKAVKELLESGCKKPALLVSHTNYRVGRQRLEGMHLAFQEMGLPFPEHMVFDVTEKLQSSGYREAGAAALKKIAGLRKKPDCWVTSSERLGWAAYSELKRKGRSTRGLRKIISLADRPIGMESQEFQDLYLGYYRHFQDLGQCLAKVLEKRLDNTAGPGEAIQEPVLCRPMTSQEAEAVFQPTIL